MKRILLGQLGVYGDCLHATTIARQIKHDNPDCHLTWAIGSVYANLLKNNPYVDTVWEYPIKSRWEVTSKWYDFEAEALALKKRGDFDEVYLTQVYPGYPERFDVTLREAMFKAYPKEITVPKLPLVYLSLNEINHATEFAKKHQLEKRKFVILFEYSPESNQSFVTEEFALATAGKIVLALRDSCVILSGSKPIATNDPDIIDASCLSFRENAELTSYCDLFIGTGSGLTQLMQTNWVNSLPIILLLKENTTASLIDDYNHFDLPTDNIIEITDCNSSYLTQCVVDCFTLQNGGFSAARKEYCERIIPDFTIIRFHMMFDRAVHYGRYLDIIPAFVKTMRDYKSWDHRIVFLSTFPESIWKLISRRIKGVG